MSGAEPHVVENKILVVEADKERGYALKTILEFLDWEPVIVAEWRGWTGHFMDAEVPQAVLIGTCEGEDRALGNLLKGLRERDMGIPVFRVLSELEDQSFGADSRNGVLGVIRYPVKYAQLTNALQRAEIFRETHLQGEKRRPVELFRSLVGSSRVVQRVRKLIEQVAPTEANVLILGESGTGKEVVARNIHYYSVRRDKPFVPINCGAIPPELLESELFGHEKGAFTGAISSRQGRFEMAEGGTLFLDEIGDMPLPMQVKLLRVLQERTFERVGSNKSMTADVRIVAATHRDLEELISEGKFREDLYYRLNVFPIEMPPLRDRVEDISLLVNELIARIEHEKRGSVRLTPAAISVLCQYSWPGNVRELANLVERLAILYPFGVVDANDLPEKFRAQVDQLPGHDGGLGETPVTPASFLAETRLPDEGIDLKEHLSNLELNLIKQALDEADGVVAHAAKLLNMRRTTLVEKLRKYGIHRANDAPGI